MASDTFGLQVYIYTPCKHASISGREFSVGAETKLWMLPPSKGSRKLADCVIILLVYSSVILKKKKMDASVGLVGSDIRSLISLVICTWYDLMFNLIMHMGAYLPS